MHCWGGGLTEVSILQWRSEILRRRGSASVRWFSRSHQSSTSVSRLVHLSSAGTCRSCISTKLHLQFLQLQMLHPQHQILTHWLPSMTWSKAQ